MNSQIQRTEPMKIILSNSSNDPIYEQIARQIKDQIIAGRLDDGQELPSIRKLALDLQISVITTKRAYEELEAAGFINPIAGKGTYVATQNKELMRERKKKIIEEKLSEAIAAAKILDVKERELKDMLTLLYKESEL